MCQVQTAPDAFQAIDCDGSCIDAVPSCACCLAELTDAEQAAPAVGGDRICAKCLAEDDGEPTVTEAHLTDAEMLELAR